MLDSSGPFEVESALIEHEAVLESAVVPRSRLILQGLLVLSFSSTFSPDVERGQVVKAFVVLSDRFSEVSCRFLQVLFIHAPQVRGNPAKEKDLIKELQVFTLMHA